MLKGLAHALGRAGERDWHLTRTAREWASVYTVEGPEGEAVRVLDIGGAYQSATYLGKRRFEPVFAYYRTFDAAFETGAPVRRALMIGGGGCAWPKHAAATHPDLVVDVVEQDPAVIGIARRYFFAGELEQGARTSRTCVARSADAPHGADKGGANESREARGNAAAQGKGGLRLIAAEGRAYLERCPRTYDAILNDAFAGAEPARSLATVQAARVIDARLSPDGVYLSNVVSRDGGADLSFLRDVVATLAQVFPNVQVIPCPDADYSDEDNFLVAATRSSTRFAGALPFDETFPGAPLFD